MTCCGFDCIWKKPIHTCRSSRRSRSRKAWTNLDAILEESDGVMVARGDLGVEMALEKVPFIQKSIIERARQAREIRDYGDADAGVDD